MPDTIRFAGYPTALVYEGEPRKSKVKKQLLWGDWIRVKPSNGGAFVPVHVRGEDGFMATADMQKERLLELIFVDVGQGDGCLIITPEDKQVVLDAGEGRNMASFLKWRFAGFKQRFNFKAAIISHSDKDHYAGFGDLFQLPNVYFDTVYTNGLMERVAAKDSEALGVPQSHGGRKYITDLVPDFQSLQNFLATPANVGKKQYPGMLKKALDKQKFGDFKMLSVQDGHVPGFGPQDPVQMELLGPVVEDVNGTPGLRWFGRVSETKNGHSVVIRIRYKNVTIFAGGDLNVDSESLLLAHHAGAASVPKTEAQRAALAMAARPGLSADIAKACHHGSAGVSPGFLTAIDSAATVISSGDEEGFGHPRADALGVIGKCSRGERPAVFCTELARSMVSPKKNPWQLQKDLDTVIEQWDPNLPPAERARLKKKIEKLRKHLGSSVAKYGAINVRTDGSKAVVAYQIERPRKKENEWDVYKFKQHPTSGKLEFVP